MRYELPTFIPLAGLTFLLLLAVGLAATPLQVLAGFTPTPTPTEPPPTLTPTEIPTATPTPHAPPQPETPTPTPVPLLPESGGDVSTFAGAAILALGAVAILAGWAIRRKG